MQLIVNSKEELNLAAKEIIKFAGEQKIWLLDGDMGSGKTTLIRAIAEEFEIVDNVQSPTFSIVNEYRNDFDDIFYHFDFYRIEKETEAMDIGVNEYFDSEEYCFIEWPQKISGLVPESYLNISISIISDQAREINLIHYGA